MLTITCTTTGAVTTCEPEAVAESIRPWFEDAPADVEAAIEDLQEALLAGEAYEEYTRYLDLTIENFGPEMPVWPSNAAYNQLLSLAEYAVLARCGVDTALKLSGEMGASTVLVRHAFIKRALGVARLREAQAGDCKAVAAIFREAHQVAHATWLAEHEELYSGARMSGPGLDVMRQIIGVSQRELAHDLKIHERTVRAWKATHADYATPSAGIATEMWSAVTKRVADIQELIHLGEERGSYECPIFTVHDDPGLVQLAATLLATQGRRFNIDPIGDTPCTHKKSS